MTTATNNAFYQSRHHLRLTGKARKALDGCAGRWPTSCRAAFPRSRFAWCAACKVAV